jgi:hypothetical protein
MNHGIKHGVTRPDVCPAMNSVTFMADASVSDDLQAILRLNYPVPVSRE